MDTPPKVRVPLFLSITPHKKGEGLSRGVRNTFTWPTFAHSRCWPFPLTVQNAGALCCTECKLLRRNIFLWASAVRVVLITSTITATNRMTGARTEGCSYLTTGWEQGFESFKAREKVLVKKYKIMSLLTLMGVLSRNILHHLCSFLHSGPVLCSWLSRQTHPGSSGTQPSHRPGAASGSAGLSAWSWWWWWSCGCWRSPCTKTGRLRLNNF